MEKWPELDTELGARSRLAAQLSGARCNLQRFGVRIRRACLYIAGTGCDPQGFFMDGLEIRRKRALFRAQHRGTKELDLILGRYAAERVPAMDEARLGFFEELLASPDPDVDQWIRGYEAPQGVKSVVDDVRAFYGLVK
jgi:antitoxin CptB